MKVVRTKVCIETLNNFNKESRMHQLMQRLKFVTEGVIPVWVMIVDQSSSIRPTHRTKFLLISNTVRDTKRIRQVL
jgi:hypothetical protein